MQAKIIVTTLMITLFVTIVTLFTEDQKVTEINFDQPLEITVPVKEIAMDEMVITVPVQEVAMNELEIVVPVKEYTMETLEVVVPTMEIAKKKSECSNSKDNNAGC